MPANDAFASATVISGRSGVALGDNVGATGNDVWWKWTAPALPDQDGAASTSTLPSYYFFTTHADIPHTGETDFDTIIALHSDESTALPELIAASADNFGWSRQSYAICRVVPGTIVYVRVRGAGGAEGNIRLVWGQAGRRFIGGAKIVRESNGLMPMGKAELTDVSAENSVNFEKPDGDDEFDAGTYIVRFTDGAWAYKDETDPPLFSRREWATTRFVGNQSPLFVGTDTGQHDVFFQIEHTGGTVDVPFDAVTKPAVGADPFHPNPVHAADWARGAMKQFHHGGGTIVLHWIDDDMATNHLADTPPQFVLYRSVPRFRANGQAFTTVAAGADTGTYFSLELLVPRAFSSFTFTLLNTGGISSASSAVVDSFTSLQTKYVGPFNYNVSTNQAHPVIRVSEDGFDIQDIEFDFTPAVAIADGSGFGAIGGGPNRWEVFFALSVTNGPTRVATATIVSSSDIVSFQSVVVLNASLVTTGCIIAPGTGFVRVRFTALPGTHPTLTMELGDGSLVFGQKTFSASI